jgi:TPR repeat protein
VNVPKGGVLTDERKKEIAGCIGLAVAYEVGDKVDENGTPIPRNYSLAVDYYKTTCRAGNAYGCLGAGVLFERGRVPPPKGKHADPIAFTFFKTGCYQPQEDAEWAGVRGMACKLASANVFRTSDKKTGKAHAKGLALGLKLAQRACELGEDESCKLSAKAPVTAP